MRTVVAVVTVVTLRAFRNCSRSPGRCGHHDRRGRNCDRNFGRHGCRKRCGRRSRYSRCDHRGVVVTVVAIMPVVTVVVVAAVVAVMGIFGLNNEA